MDPDVEFTRAVRTIVADALAAETKPRELADQLSGAILHYLEEEFCSCDTGTTCPFKSHRSVTTPETAAIETVKALLRRDEGFTADEKRLAILAELSEDICRHCGVYPGGGCQCWNDE